ncbi:MAG TPA: hypothetical protein VFW65_35870 [Pseudonocardiaceae bacterium]|nr:hypothetical protein [Pseudonocardiaceae bacterium]
MSPGFFGDPGDARFSEFLRAYVTPALVEHGFRAVGRRKYASLRERLAARVSVG